MTNKSSRGTRYKFIDGLRGLAAISVVLYHLSGNAGAELQQLLPEFINIALTYGYLGVPVFFVISGFVIALSVGNVNITPRYFSLFVLRRSIRLDITYWASIGFALLLLLMKNEILGTQEEYPSISTVILNMFYLQDLLETKPAISVVYWTLCLEIQFYLFFILSLGFAQKFLPKNNFFGISNHLILITLLGIYSILLDLEITSIPINGLFISNWHYFLMGILISNAVRGLPNSTSLFLLWIIIEISFQVAIDVKAYVVTGIICSTLIYSLWKTNRLNSILTGKVFTYLGTISYTLYLIHPDIGWKVISIGKLLLGENYSPIMAGLLLILSLLASILVAHLFHVVFERPSLWLCKELKSRNPLPKLSPINTPKLERTDV